MRKNVLQVIEAFNGGRPYVGSRGTISTDGRAIYSYRTCLLADAPAGGPRLLNVTRYSNTTSQQQRALERTYSHVAVDGLPYGATPDDLRRAYRNLQRRTARALTKAATP